jgi:hypothetical protein
MFLVISLYCLLLLQGFYTVLGLSSVVMAIAGCCSFGLLVPSISADLHCCYLRFPAILLEFLSPLCSMCFLGWHCLWIIVLILVDVWVAAWV